MRRTFIAVGFCMAVALGFASPARAALLTITDTAHSNTLWTLDVAGGCTTCTVTLQVVFTDPDGAGAGTNAYTGTFIDSVQWSITGATISSVNSVVGPVDAENTSWSGVEGTLNANQCGGGGENSVCASSSDPLGFGPIANGSTQTWTFSVTFGSQLPSNLTGVTGNIRGAFNDANGGNFTIFSPNCPTGGEGATCGSFAGSGGSGSGETLVPEPTSLLLFGTGLSMAAYRARRRKQNEKKN